MPSYSSLTYEILLIAIPNYFFYIAIHLQLAVIYFYIGLRYDSPEMVNGIGVSILYINATQLSVVVGLLSAFDTLGSNAFADGKFYQFSVYYYKSIVISLIYLVPVTIFNFFFVDSILGYLITDTVVIAECSSFINVAIFFILADVVLQVNTRYLSIIGHANFNSLAIILATFIHIYWCKLLIIDLDLGTFGASLAILISQSTCAIAGWLYIFVYQPHAASVFFPNSDSLHDLWDYFGIAWQSLFTYCLDYWSYSLMTTFAVRQANVQYSAHIIATTTQTLVFTLIKGFGLAANVMAGKYIVLQNSQNNEKIHKFIVFVCFCCVLANNLIVWGCRRLFAELYTTNVEVIEWTVIICNYQVVVNMIANLWWSLNYIMRGLGKYQLIFVTNLKYFVVVVLTSCYILVDLLGWQTEGVWSSQLIGFSCGLFGLLKEYLNLDLNECRKGTVEKLRKDAKHLKKFMDKNKV